MFWQLHFWKEKLLRDLNNNILDEDEWEMFIETAENNNFSAMALDMRNRLEYYKREASNANTIR